MRFLGQYAPATAVGIPLVRRALRVRDRISDPRRVGLTFDDGPHPEGTPAVLEALAEAEAPATFFLVGEQVERRPALAAEIVAAGHDVALHCYRHQNLLRLSPLETRENLVRGAAAIEDAVGRSPTRFRPPLGYLSGAALGIARELDWEIVLWKRIAYDWLPSATPAKIVRHLIRRLRGGEIFVLHDADFYCCPGSWRQTAAALPLLVDKLERLGFRPGRL